MNERFTPEQRNEIVRLYVVEGWSLSRIGAHFGRNNSISTWKTLKARGVSMRPAGPHNGAVHRPKPSYRSSLRAFNGKATLAACAFHQPTLIDLGPLQQRFLECVEAARMDRRWA